MSDPYAAIARPAEPDPYAGIAAPAPPRTRAPPPRKPNTTADVGQSFVSGLLSGVGQIADAADPVNQIIRAFPGGPVAQIALKPLERFTAHGIAGAMGGNRQPQTTAGRYAKTVGEFVPNAAVGGTGGVARRTAQVVIPALASEAAGQVAEKVGAPPIVQTGARVLGAVAGGGASALRTPPKKVAAAALPTPTLDQLYAQKNAAYQAVDNAGVKYTPKAFDSLITGITDEMKASNINPIRHPKAFSWMQELDSVRDQSPTLTTLDHIRQSIRRDVASATDPAEAYFGKKMIQNIDEFVNSARPDQVSAGDPQKAAALIAQARDLNTRVRKLESVQGALDSADFRAKGTGSGGNINNATRQKLRPLIDPTSKQRIRNLTPDEAAALTRTVKGTPTQNVLRQFGKLSPEGNGLMQALHLGAAWPTHGASGLLAVGGAVAKRMADAGTAKNVQGLLELIAQGGVKGRAATTELAKAPAATFESAIKELRASLGEQYAKELQTERQRLLMGSSAVLSGAASPTAAQERQRPRRLANQR